MEAYCQEISKLEDKLDELEMLHILQRDNDNVNTFTATEEAFGRLPKSPIVSTILVPEIKGTFSPGP
jgi:hypothetical protein